MRREDGRTGTNRTSFRRRSVPAALLAICSVLLMLTGLAQPASAEEGRWAPKPPPISTPWTDQVSPTNALPEYPRPQLTRPDWQNLNGVWEYEAAETVDDSTVPVGRPLAEEILVPYPPESALSGIQRHDDGMWYRRTFEVPAGWDGRRLLLHFGAVDQVASVYVNGKKVATHGGGYTGFSADVTDALTGSGPQELIVGAVDRNENGDWALGKQRSEAKRKGILYTGASGIWQTAWLEPVAPSHIQALNITPDVAGSKFVLNPQVAGEGTVEVTVRPDGGGEPVGTAKGPAGSPIEVPVAQPRLWSPDDPYLYQIDVRLLDGAGKPVDAVGSYAGMRSIGLVKDANGRARMALNGKIVFQHGPLDQGYWPDGIYTAPTDEALRFDLEKTKEFGFNMVRKHVKVEPARWYYWADKLGLLVWQDMPSLPIDLDIPPGQTPPPTEAQKVNFRTELNEMINQFRSVTSIVAWVPFNEGWGEFDTAPIANEIKASDPSRLVDASSGVNCCYSLPDTGAGDIYDDHTYVGPGLPAADERRASAAGEYGGLGLIYEGHLWPGEPQAYEMTDSPEQLSTRYREVSDALAAGLPESGMSAGIYTQTTDVENEVNGLLTYDRQLVKHDAAAMREANLRVIEAGSQ